MGGRTLRHTPDARVNTRSGPTSTAVVTSYSSSLPRTDNDKCSGPTTDGYDIAQSSQSQFTRQKELHIASNRPNEFEEEKLGLKKPRLQSEKINFQKKHEKHVDTAKRSDLLKGTAKHALSNPAGICVQGQIQQTYSGNTSNVELPKVTYGTPLSLQPLTVSMVPYPIPAKPTVVGAPITTSSPSPYVAQPTIPTKDERPVVQGTNTDDQQIVFGYSSVHLPSLETNSSWAFGSQPQIVSSLAVGTSNSLLHEDETKRSNVSTQMHPSTNLGYENKLAGLAKGNDKHVVETGASSSSKAEEGKGISYILRQKQTTNPLVVEGFRHDGSAIKPGVSSNLQFGGCGSFPDLPWVSATGPGPKGKTISGVTYKYSNNQIKVTEAVAHPLEQILPRPAQLKFISNGLQMEKKLKTKSTNKARLDCGTISHDSCLPTEPGTLLGLRILLYIVAKCLHGCRGSFTSDDGNGHDEIEMQARNALALQQYYRQQWRRPAAAAATSSSLPHEEWQSKLVIAAGCDHVSFIAQPCPLRTNDVVA
ncbi:ninja-family protein [Musa troglodytarum]|uniref:Ninja-family protein n=1 Tax=Musa troglodytarum TaxID=320322 RepID=A0A9E7HPI0_9LILI|nr:ninja-family protein [Musa troglodytarum]